MTQDHPGRPQDARTPEHAAGPDDGLPDLPPDEQLETFVLEARTVRDHLDDLASRAGTQLLAGTEISISVRHRGHDRLVATSTARAGLCDQTEYDTGAGPCVTAMDLLQVVLVPDVLEDTRWASWRRVALDNGFRSAAGIPAHVAEGVELSVNLYSEELDPWDADVLVRGDAFAQQVAQTVRLCLEVARLTTAHADALAATEARESINQTISRTLAEEQGTVSEVLGRLAEPDRAAEG
ncbi:GAF domain-containing protein [Cellulomonas cellasea]|uniref:Uncharacterized protein n=2 Tax=Cellulomonas cellasea TaxID=43670 RepID=A0A0A0B5J5_9CELL|nr:GAF domain-containing protein [Cellulomonas cellasea]KGM01089.1 hypothetical protein Q760_03880 [Cellulomonas cellasea DSM 20118]GEA87076.1 transcription antitermination regulator [Cellulomonas cellasea]